MENVKYRTVSKFNITLKKNDFIFGCIYFVTLLSLLLDQTDTAIFTSVLRKVKYVYIALMAAYFIASVFSGCKGNFIITTATIVTAILVLHTVLFGYIFTNDIVIEATHEHALQLLIFYAFGYFTYYYIHQNNCLHLFIVLSYAACIITLIYAYLTHLGEGLNIFWGIQNMFSNVGGRYRASYGFSHAGYLSYHCFVTLALSLFIFKDIKDIKENRHRQICVLILCICDLVALIFLIMAAERSGFLTAVITLFLYGILSFLKKRNLKFTKKHFIIALVTVGLILLILSVSGALTYIWENSARSLNITVNYPVFQQIGNFWTGMGYVENSGFSTANLVFGVTTSSLDMYYVYIFFTTGFIGCVMIGAAILIILLSLFYNTDKKYGIEALSLFCGMLFFAIWNVSLFSYRRQPEIILFVLVLCVISSSNQNRNKKHKLQIHL